MPETVVSRAWLSPLPRCNFSSSAPSILPILSYGSWERILILLHLSVFTGLGHLQVETGTKNCNFAHWQKMAEESIPIYIKMHLVVKRVCKPQILNTFCWPMPRVIQRAI